jgi:Leucine-rich repeat (LRR) protein
VGLLQEETMSESAVEQLIADIEDSIQRLPIRFHVRQLQQPGAYGVQGPAPGVFGPAAVLVLHQRSMPSVTRNNQCLVQDTNNSQTSSTTDAELVEARAVTDEPSMNISLPTAQQVDVDELAQELEQQAAKGQRESVCRILGFCLIAISLVFLSTSLGVNLGFRGSARSTAAPTVSPSMTPSAVPSSALTSPLDLLFDDLPDYTQKSIQNSSTPQWKAFDWLSNHQNITNLPEWRKTQLFALATFFYAFEGENWNPLIKERWMDDTKEECLWYSSGFGYFDEDGVFKEWLEEVDLIAQYDSCNSKGQFTWLDLADLQLSGLAPSVPPEISLLSSLDGIMLYNNDVERSNLFLPTEMGDMTNLTRMWLGNSSLSGWIPSQLWLLTQMIFLDLTNNQFSGSLPTELLRMTKLQELRLTDNGLTGLVPSELGFMSSMTMLDLGFNHFSGPLPTELGRMNLTILYLKENSFSGTVISEIGKMSSLVEILLDGNSFSGSIPSEMGCLTLLSWFELQNLPLLTGSIPSELSLLTSLRYLDLTNSSGLSGTIPNELCYLQNTSCTFEDVWEYTYNCTLYFDCSDILCGCDCPCFNETKSNSFKP